MVSWYEVKKLLHIVEKRRNIIMKKLEQSEIIVSEYDNLEGLICQKLKMMS